MATESDHGATVRFIGDLLKQRGSGLLIAGLMISLVAYVLLQFGAVRGDYAAALLIAGLFVALGGLYRFIAHRHPPSKLVRPESLATVSEIFIGREEDQRSLSRLVRNHELVFLTGESGAGKSTLLRRGILEEFQKDPVYLPIYMDYWAGDWNMGIRTSLAFELRRLGVKNVTPDAVVDSIGRQLSKSRRLPVIFFDQFDDYVTLNRSQLQSANDGHLLRPKEVCNVNSFWNELSQLVVAGRVHCLFALRSDTGGSHSFRFHDVEEYELHRLGPGVARACLERITSGDVVSHPEGGWEDLKAALCADLERDGLLPVRMRLVFQSLPILPSLTVRQYERTDGLDGLEASHIARKLDEAARVCGLTSVSLGDVLMNMVDRATLVTLPQTEHTLRSALFAPKPSTATRDSGQRGSLQQIPEQDESHQSNAFKKGLQDLAKSQITRQRLDVFGNLVWQLDHDYLCQPVVKLDGRRNRRRRLLEDGSRRFTEARGVLSKLTTLLRPWDQIQICFDVLRRRMTYRPHGLFAIYSTSRLIFNKWFTAALLSIVLANWVWTGYEAGALYEPIGLSESLTPLETRALWEVTQSSRSVRQEVLKMACVSPVRAVRFIKEDPNKTIRAEYVIRAALMMDQQLRDQVVKHINDWCSQDDPTAEENTACALVSVEVNQDLIVALMRVISAIEEAKTAAAFDVLAVTMSSILAHLSVEHIVPALNVILNAINKAPQGRRLNELLIALTSFAQKLPDGEVERVANAIITKLKGSSNPDVIGRLAATLSAFGPRLTSGHAVGVARLVTSSIEKTRDSSQLSVLAKGLASLCELLPAADAEQIATEFTLAIANPRNGVLIPVFAEIFSSVAGRLSMEGINTAAKHISLSLPHLKRSEHLDSLILALRSMGDRVPAGLSFAVARHIVDRIESAQNLEAIPRLTESLSLLGPYLPIDAAKRAKDLTLKAIDQTRVRQMPFILTVGMVPLCSRLPFEDAVEVSRLVVNFVDNPLSGSHVELLGRVLSRLGQQLPAEYTVDLIKLLVNSIQVKVEGNGAAFDALQAGLSSAIKRVPVDQIPVAANYIITAMKNTSKHSQLIILATVLGDLGDRLRLEDAGDAINAILAAIQREDNIWIVREFVTALSELSNYLTPAQLAYTARIVVDSFDQDFGGASFVSLQYPALARRFPRDQATRAARLIVSAIETGERDAEIGALISSLGVIGEALSDSTSTEVLSRIVPYARSLIDAPCEEMAPLVRLTNIGYVIEEVLKWPTCRRSGRERIITRIAELTNEGEAFGCSNPKDLHGCKPLWWPFVKWAEEKGYEVGRPPTPPERLLD